MIHQPHFLPWIGYFHKLHIADKIIFQDDVLYKVRYFHNRTKLIDNNGSVFWLTIPVSSPFGKKIFDVKINNHEWIRKFKRRLKFIYSTKASYYESIYPILEREIDAQYDSLLDLNINLLKALYLLIFEEELEFKLSSKVFQSKERTERVIEGCKKLKCNGYLLGQGASRNIHDLKMMEKESINPKFQNFDINKITYPQIHKDKLFHPELSILDSLFIQGPKKTGDMIKSII